MDENPCARCDNEGIIVIGIMTHIACPECGVKVVPAAYDLKWSKGRWHRLEVELNLDSEKVEN